MASGGFFGRLANLWRGFASLWISEAERKHPEVAYENAINSMIAKYGNLKSATAAIIRRRDETTERLAKEKAELKQLEADLGTALDTSQDDLALVLIQKKEAVEAEIASLTAELQQSETEAEEAKSSLLSVKDEIRKLQAEKDRMLAKMQSAEARIRVQEQIEGISVDAEVQALDNVRKHIRNTVAEANLSTELNDADLDNRLRTLRRQTGDAGAKAKLEEMKRARAQAAAAAETEPSKSM